MFAITKTKSDSWLIIAVAQRRSTVNLLHRLSPSEKLMYALHAPTEAGES